MDTLEKVKAALIAAIGKQYGCYSEKCCCLGAEDVLECKMHVTVEELAQAAIDAINR